MRKTLILHDNEYKKWVKNLNDIVSYNDFTSYEKNGDIVSASSEYSGLNAWKAFDGNLTSTTWTTNNTKTGWLKYAFNSAKKINKYTLIIGDTTRAPKSWVLEGSNDDTNWSILHTITGEVFTSAFEKRDYSFNNIRLYKYYRINVSENNGASLMQLVQIYLKDTDSIFNGYINVSSTLPTSQQFLSDGMDSLSPLLDRRVVTLEPLPMTEDSTQIESGKLFSKNLNLKKYIDIRSVKVDVK